MSRSKPKNTGTGGSSMSYTLPPATSLSLGGVIVGDNLTITAQGRLSGSGGSSSITNVTYSQLVSAIGLNSLTSGQNYRITDFVTKHYIVDGDGLGYYGPVAQVTNFVFSGGISEGSGKITINGITKPVAFDTSTKQTSQNFVNSNFTAYKETGVTISVYSWSGTDGNIIATSDVTGVPFTYSVLNDEGSLLLSSPFDNPANMSLPAQIITGETEPLIVLAISNNQISNTVKSESYPQDVIYYDWNPENWNEDISFSNDTVMIPGFKGVIYFRHDTVLDNYTGYDFRNVKFRRWTTNVPIWSELNDYYVSQLVTHDTNIYRAIKESTHESPKNPATESSYWIVQIDLSISEYWLNNSTTQNGIQAGLDYYDFKTFAENGESTYESGCRSNHFEQFKDDNSMFQYSGTILTNNVIFLDDSTKLTIYNNTIKSSCYSNTIGTYPSDNILDSRNSIIGSGFSGNKVVIGESIIANYFTNNNVTLFNSQIGNLFDGNNIPSLFAYCYTGDNFKSVNSECSTIQGVDFSASTLVSLSVGKTLIATSGSPQIVKIRYINNKGTIITADINDSVNNLALNFVEGWAKIDSSLYNSTPDSTSSILCTYIYMADYFYDRYPIKYKIDGVMYYGIIDLIDNYKINILGAPLTGEITELYFGDPSKVVNMTVSLPSTYETQSDSEPINTILHTKLVWDKCLSHLVCFRVYTETCDSSNDGIVNVILGEGCWATEDGLIISSSKTWFSTIVNIDPQSCIIYPNYAIDIDITKGTGGDATYLTVKIIIVME